MSHLERVSDGAGSTDSKFVFITLLVIIAIVFVGLMFLWGGGYFGGSQTINMMQPSTTATVTPGMPGAAGTGGAGGAAGAPGAAGATGATGSTSTP